MKCALTLSEAISSLYHRTGWSWKRIGKLFDLGELAVSRASTDDQEPGAKAYIRAARTLLKEGDDTLACLVVPEGWALVSTTTGHEPDGRTDDEVARIMDAAAKARYHIDVDDSSEVARAIGVRASTAALRKEADGLDAEARRKGLPV